MAPIDHLIKEKFQQAENILLISHLRPDGDAIGSLLGLGTALIEAGKSVQIVLVDGSSSVFKGLSNADRIQTSIESPYDVSVVLDCSDLERTGLSLDGRKPDINIDHHITNLDFAEINLVEVSAAATAQVLIKHLPEWGLMISKPAGEALLTGLLTDTIGFRTSNVTADTLRYAADMMDLGINLPEIYQRALVNKSFNVVSYWGRGLSKLERNDQIVWTSLTLDDRKAAGYPGKDDAELVNVLASVQDAAVAVLFIVQDAQHVKVSWRAKPGVDVSKIAFEFGGGGHAPAAGATIEGTLEEVIDQVIKRTERLFVETNQE
ncbi:MAG: DHH family phosphoesterase [Anaerolineaceae bacterium]|nr:DHH family phosphoesterase [Anaerolineaceae bacterium]